MKKLLLAGLFFSALSPAFAAQNFSYKVGDMPARTVKEQAARQAGVTGNLSRNDTYALMAVALTLLAYGIRNKKRVPLITK